MLHQKGISRSKGYEQLPMSPTLLKRLTFINPNLKQEILNKRSSIIALKNQPASIDPNLRDYQNQDVAFLMSIKNKGVFNQQRTGKTPTTLVTMRELNQQDALIIAPKSTIYSWRTDYKTWMKMDATILSSQIPKKKRKEIIENQRGTLIMTYGIAKNDVEMLLKRKPPTIVVDEAHRLRNFKGSQVNSRSPQMAKAIHKLSMKAQYRYALTGTPNTGETYKIYGILAFLFPRLFKNYWDFIDYFFQVDEQIINSDYDTVNVIQDFISPEKEREMQEFLELISVQRKRKDIMKWLNELEPKTIEIPATKKQIKYSDEMHKYYEANDVEAINDLDRMMKERQLAIDPEMTLGLKGKGAKTQWIIDYIDDYPDKSIIFVSSFTSYLKQLNKMFQESRLLIGDSSDEQRDRTEEAFNNKEFKILFANIEVAKEGMKLYGADTMVFIDRTLTYTDNEQVMDRILPISEAIAKDKEPQEILILSTDLPIERYLNRMLTKKASRAEIINNYGRALHS